MNTPLTTALLFALLLLPPTSTAGAEFKIGVGKVVITPAESTWMAGYAARTAPSEGKIHDLHAKAVVFEEANGARTVLVTSDLLGLPRFLSQQIAQQTRELWNIPRERLMLTFSHTHCGPVVGGDRLVDMYGLDAEQSKRVNNYTTRLPQMLIDAIRAAMDNLEPCRVEWGVGRSTFAMNRRQYTQQGVTGGANPIGPVDHDVPVLRITRGDGSVKAVVHGYACHNTTLSFQQFCGDYAGFSQAYLEEKLPGAMALFVAGCGADANPHPRRTLALAQQYGEELGTAVLGAMRQTMVPLHGPIRTGYREIPLAFSPAPARADIEKQLTSSNVYQQRRARRLLQTLDTHGALPETYPYAVQFWAFADALLIPALAGEVVADYSLRLKHELGRPRTWVIAYANDFVAYIPSLRVLREGGYEGGDSMVYFGHHGPWAPQIEEDILKTVHDLIKEANPR